MRLVDVRVRWFLALVAASVCRVAFADAYSVPAQVFAGEPRGPYQTGTFEELWVNPALDDPSTADPRDKRKVLVQIWYPAAPARNAKRAPYVIHPELYAKEHWSQKLSHVTTQSALNAPVVPTDGPLPVLLYNHGGGQPHFSTTFQTEFLASHGYVVVAIGHPGANDIQRFADGKPYVNDGKRWITRPPDSLNLSMREGFEYRVERVDLSLLLKDMSFVLDQLAALNANPASRWHRRLDLERVGALGWSLGGFLSLQATRDEPRIKAAANLDGWPYGLTGPNGVVTLGSERPLLLMFNTLDGGSGIPVRSEGSVDAESLETGFAVASYFWSMLRRSTADWYHVTVAGTTHASFSDLPLFEAAKPSNLNPRAAHAIINEYTLAFFDRYLRGKPEGALLSGQVTYPDAKLLRKNKADES